MKPFPLQLVVEGEGEVEALPKLCARILAATHPDLPLQILRPIRRNRSTLMKDRELERALDLAALELNGSGAVLVLLDSDDECARTWGPLLQARVQNATRNLSATFLFAVQEFEAWFIASAPALAAAKLLREGTPVEENPEAIRGAKEWLSRHMRGAHRYRETLDQVRFVNAMSLDEAARCPSFARLKKRLQDLVDRYFAE